MWRRVKHGTTTLTQQNQQASPILGWVVMDTISSLRNSRTRLHRYCSIHFEAHLDTWMWAAIGTANSQRLKIQIFAGEVEEFAVMLSPP